MRLRTTMAAMSAAFLLAGCGSGDASKTQKPTPQAIPVHTRHISQQTYTPSLSLLGQVVASAQVDIKSKTTGLLVAKHFADGNAVEQGQTLYTLEQTDLELSLRQAEAQLQTARVNLDQAIREERRQANLVANKAASKQDYDNALSTLQVQQAAVKAALAARDLARKGMADSLIKAPFLGKLGISKVTVGDYLTPSDSLVTLTAISPIWVTFSMSQLQYESMFPRGLDGAKVSIRLEDGSVISDATLDYSSPDINIAFGTVTMRASTSNDDDRLKAGQYVRVSVSGTSVDNVSLVPLQAVQQSEAGPYVYILRDGKAQRQIVKDAGWDSSEFQVATGLDSKDEVVMDNLLKIYPGAALEVVQDGHAGKESK